MKEEGFIISELESKGKLLYDNIPCCDVLYNREHLYDLEREKARNIDLVKDEARETVANWIKLSGVRTAKKIATKTAENIPLIIDAIAVKCGNNFDSMIKISWSNDHWNSCLLVNDSRTKIRINDLALAVEALLGLTDEQEAIAIVADIVVKKLKMLFD